MDTVQASASSAVEHLCPCRLLWCQAMPVHGKIAACLLKQVVYGHKALGSKTLTFAAAATSVKTDQANKRHLRCGLWASASWPCVKGTWAAF